MQTNIRKWGNSAGAVLPASALKKAGLAIGDALEIEVRGEEIVMRPAKAKYTLAELLAATPSGAVEKSDEDREWLESDPVGREVI